jgi:hypothetical protein
MTCRVVVAVAAAAMASLSSVGDAAELPYSRIFSRFALQLQYPQAVAISVGSWLRFWGTAGQVGGLVGDAEVGLSGASVKLGIGVSAPERTSYEKVWSFGIQASAHRTWPWWSPWLPEATTLAGGEIFVAYFAFRCFAGAMWSVSSDVSPRLVGGCGLGVP